MSGKAGIDSQVRSCAWRRAPLGSGAYRTMKVAGADDPHAES